MTVIEARQQIAELLASKAKLNSLYPSLVALNDNRVTRHIEIIRNMNGGRWNDKLASEYIKHFTARFRPAA
jgi:predicted RNase H-like nuclease